MRTFESTLFVCGIMLAVLGVVCGGLMAWLTSYQPAVLMVCGGILAYLVSISLFVTRMLNSISLRIAHVEELMLLVQREKQTASPAPMPSAEEAWLGMNIPASTQHWK